MINIALVVSIIFIFLEKAYTEYTFHKYMSKQELNVVKGTLNQFFSDFKKIPWSLCIEDYPALYYYSPLPEDKQAMSAYRYYLIVFNNIYYKYNFFQFTIINLYILSYIRNNKIPERFIFKSFRSLLEYNLY